MVVLGLALICSNALSIQHPETSCVAVSYAFPNVTSCEAANLMVLEDIHKKNKAMPPNQQFHVPLLECVPVDRPDLNEGI